ncbi:MAG: hypothetical protein GY869_23050, partial [Planctomycetes bacterium]|nr:hypothetical protein [Planctomycetota bacterium]
ALYALKSGTHAERNYGVYGYANGASNLNYAGYFNGNVRITGDLEIDGELSKGSGTFKIDHPLDPENKYLSHSFVESPDMMNVYNGNIETDSDGYATVELPEYFDALNRDFRYQLTVIGQFAQAIIAEKITENHFVIQTDKPNVEVSWQITGNGWGQATSPAGNDYIAIAAGHYHSLALKTDGSIVAWGSNSWGMTTPPAGSDYIAIAAGSDYSLALKADGSIVGWGRNNNGQANPPTGNYYLFMAAGGGHGLALK